MPANFRCQLAAIFCAATRTKAAEFLVLNNATACLDNLIKDFRKELNVFYDALAGGVTRHVRSIDESSWGGVPRWKQRGSSVGYNEVKEA